MSLTTLAVAGLVAATAATSASAATSGPSQLSATRAPASSSAGADVSSTRLVLNPTAVNAAKQYLSTGTLIKAPAGGHTTAAQRQALSSKYLASDYPLYWKTTAYDNDVDGKYPVKNQRIKLVSTWVLDSAHSERLFLSDSFQQKKSFGDWVNAHIADRVEARFYVDSKSKDGSKVHKVGSHIFEIQWTPVKTDYNNSANLESWVNYRLTKTHKVHGKKVRYYIKVVDNDKK